MNQKLIVKTMFAFALATIMWIAGADMVQAKAIPQYPACPTNQCPLGGGASQYSYSHQCRIYTSPDCYWECKVYTNGTDTCKDYCIFQGP